MKFGIVLPTFLPQATPRGVREAALLAEELDYDSVWTTDHVMIPAGESGLDYQTILESLSTLSWVGGFTSTVDLGVSALVLPQRHPVIVAKEIATIDQVSGGRMVLCVGSGYLEEEFDFLDADFSKRGSILDEGIRAMRHLWAGKQDPFTGKHFSFQDYAFDPLPIQNGGPSIWVGGMADVALRRAAALANGWHAGVLAPDEFRNRANRIASLRGNMDGFVLSLRANVRDERRIVENRFGRTLVLGGGVSRIRSDIEAYRDAGCEYVVLNFWDGDTERFSRRIEEFAMNIAVELQG